LKRLAMSVRRSKPTSGVIPFQPVKGRLAIETRERASRTEASAATQPKSARVFHFP